MRYNDKHHNTCGNRIGMYRGEQCTAGPSVCPFLSECEEHYNPDTKEFEYIHSLLPREPRPRKNKDVKLSVQKLNLPKLFKRHNGKRELILAVLLDFQDRGLKRISSKQIAYRIGDTPQAISIYLRDFEGIKCTRNKGVFFTGEIIKIVRR